ncbi:hypothetical protein RND81_05G116000 [Saponaria officinalis]|uniref:Uncharacterized protein n=1 Tax=Saponaria officinalis TaxID=3572 RepID=A0AAW1KY38_SAPOF
MSQSNNQAVGVDNTFRRKFDGEEYLERAREREEKEKDRLKPKSKGPLIQRKPLKHRDYEVDLESRLGKTQVSQLPSYLSWLNFIFFLLTYFVMARGFRDRHPSL